MNHRRRATSGWLVAACALLALTASTAAGAEEAPADEVGARTEISPPIIRTSGAAGETITENISISATGTQPVTVTFSHADFGFEGSTYQVQLIPDTAPETTSFSTRGWFSVPDETITIAAGETEVVPLSIEIPENAPGGTYLGAARFANAPAKARGGQIAVTTSITTLVFITVDGGDPPKASITTFDAPKLVTSGPIRPKIVIENEGDEFFTYQGTIELEGAPKDAKGREVVVREQFVVPGEPREVRASPDDKAGEGRPELGSKQLGLGRHTITASFKISPTGATVTSSVVVWVVPVWAWVAAGVLLAGLVVGAVLLVRRMREHRAYLDDEFDEPDEDSGSEDAFDEHDDDQLSE